MDKVQIRKRPKLKRPFLIVAWPGMGEVAFRAVSHLVDKLKAEPFAQLASEDFFYLTSSVIQNGILGIPELPANTFYYWKNKAGENDLIIFLSNAQPDLTKAEAYSQQIIQVAKAFKTQMVISFAAMPQPVDHTQPVNVWVTSTSQELNNTLKKHNVNFLSDGQISGMNGLFLGIAKREGLAGICLLGEIPLYTIQIENPKASGAVLEAFSKITRIQLDLASLINQAHAMEEEINKLLDYLKVGSPSSGPISEEDIEKIKKSLGQLVKLPVSIKQKIEDLFTQSGKDISKAGELKAELDKWSVYKEYEDRFLDLFRKSKDKNN
ncbi:MAG TPA: PAC2 family protein [Patescibacteria group bacterium]|nr:PAC2 family protein [Patescibacteria group bacterium]